MRSKEGEHWRGKRRWCWSVERIRLEHRKLQTKEIVVDTCFILNFPFVSFLIDRHSSADGCACREGYNAGE